MNYTRADAQAIRKNFIDAGNSYPYDEPQQIIWGEDLLMFAMEAAHANGYTQRAEGN